MALDVHLLVSLLSILPHLLLMWWCSLVVCTLLLCLLPRLDAFALHVYCNAKTRPTTTSLGATSSRRSFLTEAPTLLSLGVASAAIVGGGSSAVAGNGSPGQWEPTGPRSEATSYFPTIEKGYAVLKDLDQNWDEVTKKPSAGDDVRRVLGTVGNSSPLSYFKKASAGIRDAAVIPAELDVIDFAEKSEEVITELVDADNDAYSSNFAEFSAGAVSAKIFLDKARKSVKSALRLYKELMQIMGKQT